MKSNPQNEQESYEENEGLTEHTAEDGTESLQEFIKKYGKFVITAGVAVIVAFGLYYFISSNNEKTEKEASIALSRVWPFYAMNDYGKALTGDSIPPVRGEKVKGLRYIADEYSGTAAGKIAAMYAGEALVATGKVSEAKAYFEKASGSESDIIKLGASAGQAICLETEGKNAEAAEQFMKAAEMTEEPGSKARYSYYSALCYEKTGKKGEAEKIYRKIILENQTSEFNGMSKSALVRIGTIIE